MARDLNEADVRSALMQRFDENRNEKLEYGESRQARTRLQNLLEDKSEREINIRAWRDDVRELLQTIDTDGDNRISVQERDLGSELIDRLIPEFDESATVGREKSKDLPSKGESVAERLRSRSRNSSGTLGSFGGYFGGNRLGGGGFGMNSTGFGTRGSNFGGMSGGFPNNGAGANSAFGQNLGMASLRPGVGDPGSSVVSSIAGEMNSLDAHGFGAKSQSAFSGSIGGFGGELSELSGGSKHQNSSNSSIGISEGAIGAVSNSSLPSTSGTGRTATSGPSSFPGPLGDAGQSTGSAFPMGPESGSGKETPASGGMSTPTSDSLGGGMGSPIVGGTDGPDGSSTVPFNPMPNF